MELDQFRQQGMSDAERSVFAVEVANRERSVVVGYLAWLLIGFHYAYVGKWVAQLLFWLTGGGLFVWWLVDLFRVPGIIDEYNRRVRDEVALSITSLRRGASTQEASPGTSAPQLVSTRASPEFGSSMLWHVASFLLGGALVGLVVASIIYTKVSLSDESTNALCMCQDVAAQTTEKLIVMEVRGAGVGALLGLAGAVPGLTRIRRRRELATKAGGR